MESKSKSKSTNKFKKSVNKPVKPKEKKPTKKDDKNIIDNLVPSFDIKNFNHINTSDEYLRTIFRDIPPNGERVFIQSLIDGDHSITSVTKNFLKKLLTLPPTLIRNFISGYIHQTNDVYIVYFKKFVEEDYNIGIIRKSLEEEQSSIKDEVGDTQKAVAFRRVLRDYFKKRPMLGTSADGIIMDLTREDYDNPVVEDLLSNIFFTSNYTKDDFINFSKILTKKSEVGDLSTSEQSEHIADNKKQSVRPLTFATEHLEEKDN